MIDFVRLSQADRDQARVWEAEVLASLKDRINPMTGTTEGLVKDRYYFGYCGEIATDHWLAEKGIDHTFRVNTSGESQKSEFLVPRIGRLEVKTSSVSLYHLFMMPVSADTDFAIVLGVRLNLNLNHPGADIMGWFGHNDIPKLEIVMERVLTREIEYARMRKLPRIVEICLARQHGTLPEKKPMNLRQARCRSCRAPIVWMKTTPKRKNISVDPDGIDEADLEWDGDHPLFDPKKGHITHFATCPNADSHRKS